MVTEVTYHLNKDNKNIEEKEKKIFEIFESSLKDKILSLNLIQNTAYALPNYSGLGFKIMDTHIERLYINFIRQTNLCLESLGYKNKTYISFGTFKSNIRHLFSKEKVAISKEEYESKFNHFLGAFEQVIKAKAKTLDGFLSLQKEISKSKELESIANTVIETFISIIAYQQTNKEVLENSTREYKIIEAISDTLEIKIENIKESTNNFIEEINNFEAEISLPENFIEEILELWYKLKPSNMEEITIFLEETAFKDSLPKINKIALKLEKSHKKNVLEYKKNQLLFEVTTFNELLNYSVEILKKSTDMEVLMYIQVVEEANSMINTTLIKHLIRPIYPEIGSIFNSKEQEVIMTEKDGNFKKGEIIKVANHGYKQKDIIIIKANVIVAR